MPKVTVVQVVYNNKDWIEPVFSAIFSQTFKDFNVVAVISGNDDGSKELLGSKFPQVKIIDPGYNIGFSKGHNLVFDKYLSSSSPLRGEEGGEGVEFFQLVNPDLILEPNYIEEMLKVFEDKQVGAATGKLYKINQAQAEKAVFSQREGRLLDTTGVIISRSGRARDRGQHEVDTGQYDASVLVNAVSGAGCMYRRSALEEVKLPKLQISNDKFQTLRDEYFDEDFHSYWEDVDLSWRMKNKGWKNVFVPSAIGYHGRAAGSSKTGYADVIGFIKHHRSLPERIRRLNYKNHIFMYIKNSPWFYPQFFLREFFMLIYILLFEISTLKVLPELFKLLPKIWKKRKVINTALLSRNAVN